MNSITCRGSSAGFEFDDGAETFVDRIAGIDDVIGFHGDSVAGRKAAFHEAVDDYVETCARIGKESQKPFSGRMMFRVSPKVHHKAALAAELSGKSLNQWPEEALDKAAN